MKTLLFTLCLFSIVICTSCEKEPSYVLSDKSETLNFVPVCILWYGPSQTGWELIKSWDANEAEPIWNMLWHSRNMVFPVFGPTHKLSVVFYDGKHENLKLYEFKCEIQKGHFYTEIGSSPELWKIFSEFLPDYTDPADVFKDPNMMKDLQKKMDQSEKLKTN